MGPSFNVNRMPGQEDVVGQGMADLDVIDPDLNPPEVPDLDKEVEPEPEPAPAPPPPAPTWDKERQMRDQLAGMDRKLAEERAEKERLRSQIDQMTSAQNQGEAIDLDVYDNLKDEFLKSKQRLDQLVKLNTDQQKLITELQAEREERRLAHQKSQGMQVLNEYLNGLDKEFGPEFRNEAQEVAAKEFEEGEIGKLSPAQQNAFVRSRLRLAYLELRDKTGKAKPAAKTSPGTTRKLAATQDTGTGGGSQPLDDIPEGSMDEVLSACRKAWSAEEKQKR